MCRQRPRRSHARGQYASLSRISLLWKNRSAKIDPAAVAQTEDKKQGQQREKEKQEDKEQANPSKDKEPAKEKPGSKETGDKANNDEQENGFDKEEKREDKQKKPGRAMPQICFQYLRLVSTFESSDTHAVQYNSLLRFLKNCLHIS